MNTRAVLLDMDGTIFDSGGEKGMRRFFEVARRRGLAVEERHRALIREKWGATADELLGLSWPKEDFHEFHRAWALMDNQDPPSLIHGAFTAIETLYAARVMLGVLTNRDSATTANLVEACHLRKFFAVSYTRSNLPRGAKKTF